MEDLMELVAASFARYGIDCGPKESRLSDSRARPDSIAIDRRELAAALPEHNYRKIVQGDPSP